MDVDEAADAGFPFSPPLEQWISWGEAISITSALTILITATLGLLGTQASWWDSEPALWLRAGSWCNAGCARQIA